MSGPLGTVPEDGPMLWLKSVSQLRQTRTRGLTLSAPPWESQDRPGLESSSFVK